MSAGFIKLHKKILNWEWYSDINTCRLFLHLLLTAKFKDEKWRGLDIKRGQVLTGRKKLAKSTSLTESQIRTSIFKLKSTNEITIKITNEFSIITLTNYELYQSKFEIDSQPDSQQTAAQIANESPTNRQRIATDKEIQELEEIKRKKEYKLIIETEFDEFWKSYTPVKTSSGKFVEKGSKKSAKEAFIKQRSIHSFDDIFNGCAQYLANCYRNDTLSCQASVCLNQERFLGDFNSQTLNVQKNDKKNSNANY
jgi:hypothetical protein